MYINITVLLESSKREIWWKIIWTDRILFQEESKFEYVSFAEVTSRLNAIKNDRKRFSGMTLSIDFKDI